MKALKIIILTILSIFVLAYLAFLFVLPNSIDLNQYSPQLTKEIEKATGFQVQIKGLKVKTAWNLSGGALIEKTDLKYPKNISNGEKFAQINGLEVKLSLLPLFLGQIRVDSVDLDRVILNLKVEKSGKFILEQCMPKADAKQAPKNSQMPFNLKFSPSMPDISVGKYKVAFIDATTGKTYAIKGADFKVSDFVLEKKIKVKAIGDVILDGRKQVAYDLSVYSKVLPSLEAKPAAKNPQEVNIIGIFKDLYKYNMNAKVLTDLKITGSPDDVSINGDLTLDNVYFTLDGKTLPKSNLALKFKGNKVKIKSNFYTDIDKKAVITGIFENGRNQTIDLRVISKKTDIGNTFLIANNLLQMFGNKNLNGIKADGELNADFKIKSDFKKVQSSGFLKINNANITDKLYNVSIKDICADIDFSQNEINIIKSRANLDGRPIIVKGTINADANANLSVFAENIQLKALLATLGQLQTLKENDIQSGLISVKASLKGRLDKAIPTFDIAVKNVSLKNRQSRANVQVVSAKIKAVSNGKKTNGIVEVAGMKLIPPGLKAVSLPKMNVTFNEKDLNINSAILYFNKSKIDIFGSIRDYQGKKAKSDITARGLIYATDIKSILPKQNQAGVSAVGKIPLLVRITGNGKYDIHAQLLANQTNHLAVFDVDTLRGKTSLINAQLSLADDNLHINEIALYALRVNRGLSQNMKSNISSGTKVAFVIGKIFNISSKNPSFKDIGISVPNQLTTSIPGYKNSSVHIKGDISLGGTLKNPDVKGYLTVPYVYVPTIKTNMRNMVVHFNRDHINLTCPVVTVVDSLMGFNSLIINDFTRGIIVKNVDFKANYLNLDSLGAAFSNLPQNVNGPGADLGVTILGGTGEITKFKTGGIVATNVVSDVDLKNNWINLNNVHADAYLGKIAGNVKYNLIYGNIKLDLQGRNLSAGPAIRGLTGISDSMQGQLDFDSDISMTGYSQNQLLSTLKGNTEFIMSNGKMGKLGQLEHLLYAQNVISNNFFRTSLNVIGKAITVKNTGLFKYIKGKVTFSHGWAEIGSVQTSGPSMSMYITGRYNLLNKSANLVILGRLSDDVVRVLGPIGDLSMDKVLSYIPKIGTITSLLINQMTTNPNFENTSMIPHLSPKTELPTKEFKVVFNGGVDSQGSVKSFKWLSNPTLPQEKLTPKTYPQVGQVVTGAKKMVQQGARDILQQVIPVSPSQNTAQPYQNRYVPAKKIIAPVADFINSLPDLKD